jgi:hypothetical protein
VLADLWFALLTRQPGLDSGMMRWSGYMARWLGELQRQTNFYPESMISLLTASFVTHAEVLVERAMNIGLYKIQQFFDQLSKGYLIMKDYAH